MTPGADTLGGATLGGLPGGSLVSRPELRPRQLFVLHEATLSLYPAGADGEALLDRAIWWGACANGLSYRTAFEELLFARTGARHRRAYHVDEETDMEIERTWFIPGDTLRDFRPGRNTRYVLVVLWWDAATSAWYRRIFYGVTFREIASNTEGVMQTVDRQRLRAERWDQDGGATAYTPAPPAGTEFALPFFHEEEIVAGEYLAGHYRFGRELHLTGARVIARAPDTEANVLTLEVDGVLTAVTATIPVDGDQDEVAVDVSMDLHVAAGARMRWRITTGSDTGNAAYQVAVNLEVEAA